MAQTVFVFMFIKESGVYLSTKLICEKKKFFWKEQYFRWPNQRDPPLRMFNKDTHIFTPATYRTYTTQVINCPGIKVVRVFLIAFF